MAFDLQLSLRVSSALTSRSVIPNLEILLTMSNWINDEANSNNEREQRETYEKRLIQQSNYWARIVQQVQADVNAINEHDYWKHRLGMVGFPLQFAPHNRGEGYYISKSGNPAVMVTILATYEGDISITRDFHENPVADRYNSDETLTLKVKENNVTFITESNLSLMVPEQVSQYILKAVMDSLKITKPVD